MSQIKDFDDYYNELNIVYTEKPYNQLLKLKRKTESKLYKAERDNSVQLLSITVAILGLVFSNIKNVKSEFDAWLSFFALTLAFIAVLLSVFGIGYAKRKTASLKNKILAIEQILDENHNSSDGKDKKPPQNNHQ